MRSARVIAATAALLAPAASSHIALRANHQDATVSGGKDNACYPNANIKGLQGPIPPCISIASIEEACQPNGTSSIDLEAHAQCMCHGSYFSDYVACQNCLYVHGLRSQRDNAYWDEVISAASHALCSGTPTAVFKSIFASVQTNTVLAPFVTTGNTQSSDQYPGNTAVSLYYTGTVSQGPGVITGAAASATATATKKSEPSATNVTTGTSVESDNATTASDESGSESSATAGTTEESESGSAGAETTSPASSSTGGASAQYTGAALAVAGAVLAMAF